jgi:hypothetical protein
LKDAIMVTAAGADTLPFLASFGVLPASVGFFVLYGKMVRLRQHRREAAHEGDRREAEAAQEGGSGIHSVPRLSVCCGAMRCSAAAPLRAALDECLKALNALAL